MKGILYRGRPSWFTLALDRPSPWAEIRIDPAGARAWVAGVAELWLPPGPAPELVRLWEQFIACQARMREDLDRMEWSEVSAWDLVAWVEAAVSVQLGILRFLPPEVADLDPNVRRWLFVQALILKGLETAASGELAHPLLPALRAAASYMGGDAADAKIGRRGAGHVGFLAGMLCLLMAALRQGALGSALAGDQERAVEALKKSVWRRVPAEQHPEVLGQIQLTLEERWGQLDPLETLARALQGELNIAPRAIQDDLLDQLRGEVRREQVEVQFKERTEMEDGGEDMVPSPEWGPEEERRWRECLSLVEHDARFRRLLLAAMEGAETEKEIAERLRVTDRTVRNWITLLKERLQA